MKSKESASGSRKRGSIISQQRPGDTFLLWVKQKKNQCRYNCSRESRASCHLRPATVNTFYTRDGGSDSPGGGLGGGPGVDWGCGDTAGERGQGEAYLIGR